MQVDVIAGARPNFMKVAALFAIAADFPTLTLRFVHTGQHYDFKMSDVFLQELGLPEPDRHLGVGSGSHAHQTAEIMKGYEAWVTESRPALCLVVGDVNSTIACALVAAKLGIRIAHVEAGLRSFDRAMPEEINRVLTDSISDYLFVSEPSGVANLADEGRPASAIHLVGQVMIDTLLRMLPKAEALHTYKTFDLPDGEYAYVTLHRPSNVDEPAALTAIVDQLGWVAQRMPVIFPVHPRTRARIESAGLQSVLGDIRNLRLVDPVGYLDSLSLLKHAAVAITDSGGLQEESSALMTPCLTVRENTERPITIAEGTNTLIGHDWALFRRCMEQIMDGAYKRPAGAIPYWDGHAGRRIMTVLAGR
jgi:UDP-N-acetylglucosamine 2-epimerase (non-hydrolysing)